MNVYRSLFFTPANRQDLLAKVARANADCNVIDLEDGTPPAEISRARQNLAESVRVVRAGSPRGSVFVRVNAPRSEHFAEDLRACAAAGADGVVVPKLESPTDARAAAAAASTAGAGVRLLAGIESGRGVANIESIVAETAVEALYFGAEDFAADVGARRTEAGTEVLYARSRVLLAAKLAGVTAIDQAVGQVRDDDRFLQDANVGRDLGYQGKICVTPHQVELAHGVFTPTPEEVAHARRVLDAYAKQAATGIGTSVLDGMLIEGPLLRRAESVVALFNELNLGGARA